MQSQNATQQFKDFILPPDVSPVEVCSILEKLSWSYNNNKGDFGDNLNKNEDHLLRYICLNAESGPDAMDFIDNYMLWAKTLIDTPVVDLTNVVDISTAHSQEEPIIAQKKAKQRVNYGKGEFKKVYSRHLYASAGIISLAQLKLSWLYSKLCSFEEEQPFISRVCDVDIKRLRMIDDQNLLPKDLSDFHITTKSKLVIRNLEAKILDEDTYILIENKTLSLYKSVELIILHSVVNQMKITGDKRDIKKVLTDKGLDVLIGKHLQREIRSLKL